MSRFQSMDMDPVNNQTMSRSSGSMHNYQSTKMAFMSVAWVDDSLYTIKNRFCPYRRQEIAFVVTYLGLQVQRSRKETLKETLSEAVNEDVMNCEAKEIMTFKRLDKEGRTHSQPLTDGICNDDGDDT